MEFQKHINGLRALAVIAIVLYHFKIIGFAEGFVGVDVFFVISGFLITNILLQADLQGKFSPLSFYINRLRRIGPALAALCLTVAVVCGLYQLSGDYTRLLRNDLSSLFYLSNFSFRNEAGYFDAATDTKPLIHTWSLAVEWQFYLCLPLLVFLTRRMKAGRLAVFALLAGASLAWCIVTSRAKPDDAFYLLPSRAWEFLLGGMLTMVPPGARLRQWSGKIPVLSIAGLSLLLASLWLISDATAFPGWQALIPTIAAALILLENGNNWVNRMLGKPLFQFFGNISYAWYLWHWPIWVWLCIGTTKDNVSLTGKCIGLGVSVAMSYASFRWIEMPTRKNKTLWTNRRIVCLYVGAILIAATALGVAFKTDGMAFRLPSYIARAEYASHDVNPRRDECFLERADSRTKDRNEYCKIGIAGNAEPSIILWGDSFADTLQVAADTVAAKLGEKGEVATISGCAPIDTFPFADPVMKALFPNCATDFNKRVIEHIQQTDTLRTVIMAGHWLHYDADIVARRLPQIACGFARAGKHVILVGPIPSADSDVPHTWAAHQLASRHAIDDMSMPENSQAKVVKKFQEISTAVAATCDGVTILQPMATLCDGQQCSLVKNGVANYTDQWHLSTHGATLLTEPLLQAVQENPATHTLH